MTEFKQMILGATADALLSDVMTYGAFIKNLIKKGLPDFNDECLGSNDDSHELVREMLISGLNADPASATYWITWFAGCDSQICEDMEKAFAKSHSKHSENKG